MRGTATERRQRSITAEQIAVVFVVLLGALDVVVAAARPYLGGDTAGVVKGAAHVIDCARHGMFTRCNYWPGRPRSYVGPWPVLQYIPAVGFQLAGASQRLALRLIIVIDAVALVAAILMGWRVLHRRRAGAWTLLFMLAMVTSPLWWYGISAFGEALAAALIVTALASLVSRCHPAIVGSLFMLAAMTKETNGVFVAGLVIAYAVAQSSSDRTANKRVYVAVGAGLFVGFVVNALFNLFRFGSVRNLTYLHSYAHVPNGGTAVRFFGALWFAPNGGLSWFWPVGVVVLSLGLVRAIRPRSGAPTRVRVAVFVVTAVAVANIASLALWYSPFGWLGWGPRLSLTVIPGALFMMCVLAPELTATRYAMPKTVIIPAAVVGLAAGVPEIAVLFAYKPLGRFFSNNPQCVGAHVATNPRTYYACVEFLAWHKRPLMLRLGSGGLFTASGMLAASLLTGAVIALTWALRDSCTQGHSGAHTIAGDVLHTPG